MAGALPDDNGSQALSDYVEMQQLMQQRGSQQPSGALPTNSSDESDIDQISGGSQQWRDLQLLEAARGLSTAPHTGRMEEGWGNMLTNLSGVQQKHMAMDANIRSKMAQIEAQNQAKMAQIAETAAGREDVANIMTGARTFRTLSPDEVKAAGYAPGTIVQANRFGQQHVVQSPPSNQRMLTGYDDNGQPKYADPGEALAPQMRTAYQDYLRKANQSLPQMEDLISKLENPESSTAVGLPGTVERALEATAGQKGAVAPQDLALRTQMSHFNSMAHSLLQADPRNQAMGHAAIQEMMEDLPDPDSMWESRDKSLAKLKQFRDNMKERMGQYEGALRGEAPLTSGSPLGGMGGSSGAGSFDTGEATDALSAELMRRGYKKNAKGEWTK